MIFEDVEILDTQDLSFECDCSKEKMGEALATLHTKDLEDMINEDHGCEITCQFCNAHYQFSEDELKEILKKRYAFMRPPEMENLTIDFDGCELNKNSRVELRLERLGKGDGVK